jgi:hypothetical protein
MDHDERFPKTISCFFCRGAILFQGLPAKRYHSHLGNLIFSVNFLTENSGTFLTDFLRRFPPLPAAVGFEPELMLRSRVLYRLCSPR